jgi:molybdopterin converting factor small subunit
MATMTVEFFGIPRARAGVPELVVPARTVAQALAEVATAIPALADLLQADGRLAPHYLLCVGGGRFDVPLNEPLPSGARLLLLSADAGG